MHLEKHRSKTELDWNEEQQNVCMKWLNTDDPREAKRIYEQMKLQWERKWYRQRRLQKGTAK